VCPISMRQSGLDWLLFMRKFLLAVTLAYSVALPVAASGGETETPKSAVPEELIDAWERLQRALQDWSGRIRERLGVRDSREDRPTISQILSYREYLGLTAEQVKKLEQLRDNFQRQSIRTDADLKIVELDITALLDSPTVDVGKVEAKIREAEKLRADLRIARVRTIEQAKSMLTAEQRKKFLETAESRSGRPPRSGQNPPATEK
jgi:Spy/CpxP family protein refolding chaperone